MDQSEIKREYTNGEITIVWRPALCIHAGVCWQTLPEVYKPALRPWVRPQYATTAQLRDQIDSCPSKALTWFANK
jgi:uncharacterized Fe-S cluster protein YjdI